ncbi:hypothetical protein [Pseudalkalibacillus sp. SCS-8]|uniref:hypothetical protein n=1 Tax=Pseudalkalibacillus nanhaiensis TaxID=3115291 RepID=UPI0032D9FD3E
MKQCIWLLVLLATMIAACQQDENKDELKLEVKKPESEETVAVVTDQAFISKLIEALDKAETISTAMMDLRQPDYKVIIKKNEETLYELGYYTEVMKLGGLAGRYLNREREEFYGVTIDLPLK